MSDIEALFQFASTHAGPGSSPYGRVRDLRELCASKSTIPGNLGHMVKVTFEAVDACGLGSMGPRLYDEEFAMERAAATVVLASAVVHGTAVPALTSLYKKMLASSIEVCISELRMLMTEDDLLLMIDYPHVLLKNFTSAGSSNRNTWIRATMAAYERSGTLLERASQHFVGGKSSPRVKAAFEKYFVSANPEVLKKGVHAHWMKWQGLSKDNKVLTVNPPRFSGYVSPDEVVGEVLRRVYNVYLTKEPVTFHLGGIANLPDVSAYVRSMIKPTDIYLAARFFDDCPMGGDRRRAATVIHELTHTWARTIDYFNDELGCTFLPAQSPGLALSNADSYGLFVEEAFG